ncbi:MAG TPA: DUF5671 domain-containing protein [Thermoanaerobaculia bacterium]|nr:DUF5671 domain-containing protein [Thermoanaerobaculia bacterium]
MAIDEQLSTFVHEALARGLERSEIEKTLLRAGWNADDVRAALASYAEVDFPIPVPRPRPHVEAREAFLYLVLFTTLYISAYNFGALLYQFIERAFPDSASPPGWQPYLEVIRWSVASLVIAFPIFLLVSRIVGRSMARDPSKRGSSVRKWLTYLTLFIASGVIIGDLIALVYNLLGGELTVRFILKVLVVAAIAGTVFGYYLRDLRRVEMDEVEQTR